MFFFNECDSVIVHLTTQTISKPGLPNLFWQMAQPLLWARSLPASVKITVSSTITLPPKLLFNVYSMYICAYIYTQGGSNMTGTNCDLFTHKSSRSYLNHLVNIHTYIQSPNVASGRITKSTGRGFGNPDLNYNKTLMVDEIIQMCGMRQ
jgi:hypothetical protein